MRFTLDGCLSVPDRDKVRYYDRPGADYAFKIRPNPAIRIFNPLIRIDEMWENYTCFNSYIRDLEVVEDPEDGEEALWACGTFGSFPRAYLFNPYNLTLKRNVTFDLNLPTCARWPDEQMATIVTKEKDLYIASGWGLYRPNLRQPDVKDNNSTMLYADWRLLTSGHAWFSRMAMVLGRDVNFINYVKETENYLYFFGREVSPQYSQINIFSNEITQSFVLRICKNDVGYRYDASEEISKLDKTRGNITKLLGIYGAEDGGTFYTKDFTRFSFTNESYRNTYHAPTKHFVSARKYPFGCYLKRYDGAQTLNRFWGEQNIIYFNRVADVELSFKLVSSLTEIDEEGSNPFIFYQTYFTPEIGRAPYTHPNTDVWNPMIGAFSSTGFRMKQDRGPGYRGTTAHGAICQFQLSEWKDDYLSDERNLPKELLRNFGLAPVTHYRDVFAKNQRQFPNWYFRRFDGPSNYMEYNYSFHTIRTRHDEFMAYYGTKRSNFYDKLTTWFQGGQIGNLTGIDLHAVVSFLEKETPIKAAGRAGRCLLKNETEALTRDEFLNRMRFASTAWPTEWDTWASKYYDAVFHMNPVQVAGDNASFIAEGVEFLKMFVIFQNFTDFVNGSSKSPITYVILVTTEGEIYRVVMCDIVSIPINDTTCEFNNTDQPYITKFFEYMRGHSLDLGQARLCSWDVSEKAKQIRVSSLLSVWRATEEDDKEIGGDVQTHTVKDAQYRKDEEKLYITTRRRLMTIEVSATAVCSSYHTCVHCASDPLCGWSPRSKRCSVYGKYNIQDVLRRGEICKNYIEEIKEIQKEFHLDPIRLNCIGANYFRGIISWQINGTTIDPGNSKHRKLFSMPSSGSVLVIFSNPLGKKQMAHFQCIGTSMDSGQTTTLANYTVLRKKRKSSTNNLVMRKLNERNEVITGNLWCFDVGKCDEL